MGLGLRARVQGFWIQGLGFRDKGLGGLDLGFRGFGFRVKVQGFWI